MNRNMKTHTHEMETMIGGQPRKTGINETKRNSHSTNSCNESDEDGKTRRKYSRSEQKRIYLHFQD